MTKADSIVAELIDALDLIRREAEGRGSLPYIVGVAEQATKNCNARRERNADGYLVVRS